MRLIAITLLLFSFATANTFAQKTCITKDGYIASISEELFSKAIAFAVQKDHAAFQKLLDSKLVFMLKAGIPVFVEKTKIFSGAVKIRPKGSTTILVWTNIEAINCE